MIQLVIKVVINDNTNYNINDVTSDNTKDYTTEKYKG
jgi:hypothetical protein